MERRKGRGKWICVGLVILVLCFEITGFAAKQGRIQVILQDGVLGTSKSGVEIGCCKVAEWENGTFQWLQPYREMGVQIEEDTTATQLQEVAYRLEDLVTEYESRQTDAEGIAVFQNLTEGLYFIRVLHGENYEKVSPAIVAIPNWNQEGDQAYQIQLYPKHQPEPGTILTKIGDWASENVATGDQSVWEDSVRLLQITGLIVTGVLFVKRFARRNQHE